MSVLSFKLLSHQKSTDVIGAQRVQDELVPQRLEPNMPYTQHMVPTIILKGLSKSNAHCYAMTTWIPYNHYHDKPHIAMLLTEVMQKAIMHTKSLYM